MRWATRLLDDGDVASDVLADLLRCQWLLHEYPSVDISTWKTLGFLLNFLNFRQFP
jgi:hypothetical protein